MSFDTKRYIRDYCRNPVKTQTAALRGEYAQPIVTVRRGDLIRGGGFDRAETKFGEWLTSSGKNLSCGAREAVAEIERRGFADVKISIENELLGSLRRWSAARRRM